LRTKLEKERFDEHIAANPMLLRVNQEAAAKAAKAEEEARLRAEARRKLEGEEGEGQEGAVEQQEEEKAEEVKDE